MRPRLEWRVPDYSKPTPILLDELPADLSAGDREALLRTLRSHEEIVGIEVDGLALVARGANLTPWRSRKSIPSSLPPKRSEKAMPDTAIPAAMAEPVVLVLGTSADNLTAIKGQVDEATEGASSLALFLFPLPESVTSERNQAMPPNSSTALSTP